MPLGPIEAAGAGLPLLLSQIEGHSMLQDFSRMYSLENPAEGARELQAALAQPGSKVGFEALKQASMSIRANYSLGAMTSRYEALYGRGWVIPVAPAVNQVEGAEA